MFGIWNVTERRRAFSSIPWSDHCLQITSRCDITLVRRLPLLDSSSPGLSWKEIMATNSSGESTTSDRGDLHVTWPAGTTDLVTNGLTSGAKLLNRLRSGEKSPSYGGVCSDRRWRHEERFFKSVSLALTEQNIRHYDSSVVRMVKFKSPFLIYYISNLALRLGGYKTKEIDYLSVNLDVFSSPKPRGQIGI